MSDFDFTKLWSFAEKLFSYVWGPNSELLGPAIEKSETDLTPYYIYGASILALWLASFPIMGIVGVITLFYGAIFGTNWFSVIKFLTSLSSQWNLFVAYISAPLIASWFWVWTLDGLHFIDVQWLWDIVWAED